MGEDPTQIRHDIERTRADMGATLDEIGDRVSPGRIVERRKQRVRDRLQSVRTRVMGSPDEYTYPQYAGGDVYSAYGESSSGSRLSGVTEGVSNLAGGLKDTVSNAPQQVRQSTQGTPLLAGALAFGAGLLASTLLPPTEPEQKAAAALQDKAQPLKEQVKQAASEVGSTVADTAKQAGEELKEQAQESAELVRSEAQSRAQDVKDEAQSRADEVKQQAQESAQEVKENTKSSTESVNEGSGS